MASGFSDSDFYSQSRGGQPMTNSLRVQYHPQFGGIFVDEPSPFLSPPAKRSVSKFESQQQQNLLLLRSVKQRTLLTSPISPLSPFDFSSASPEIPTNSAQRFGFSLFQHQNQQPHIPKSPSLSFSAIPSRFHVSETEPPEKEEMKNQLQELERRLFEDDDDEEEEEDGRNCSTVSALTTSEWSETVQNLLTPKPLPTSPATSSSSTSTAASSSPSQATPNSSYKQLLMDSAAAISEWKMEIATSIIAGLKRASNALSGDPEQRLAAYMASALMSRINPAERGGAPPGAELCSSEHLAATQMLYEASPIFNLGFFAADLAILEATRDHPKIHIVDFDIGDGAHYTYLIRALAERRTIKPTVKITALLDPSSINGGNSNGIKAGRRSDDESGAIGRHQPQILHPPPRSHRSPERVADESVSPVNPRDGLLRAAKGLRPEVVVLLEQEMNSNTAPFQARVGSAWAHYLMLFQSLDSTRTRDGSDRVRVEECLARKAANAVAREGVDRIERCEVFGKWRSRMGMAGFNARPLGAHIANSVQTRLGTSNVRVPRAVGAMKWPTKAICSASSSYAFLSISSISLFFLISTKATQSNPKRTTTKAPPTTLLPITTLHFFSNPSPSPPIFFFFFFLSFFSSSFKPSITNA
ncbi:scarecrow-like protein 8 [Cinnamomum micranthum f. kanehirae]|uniref:Scarecrow-like protein 8 n=1 Tax=Cinnamomum micranthum f. kanehirae TaxID=337451 RepID=A0A3S3NFG0_9MAGN|nr:scarecrow-like protein 8 [Cinnamomum micranthum f. kanehirae]